MSQKIFLELSHDCFIHYSPTAKTFHEGGVEKFDWVNEAAGTVKGNNYVTSASILQPELDQYGNRTERFIKLYLTVQDIKTLASKVAEIEAEEVVMPNYNDDLPW